MSSTATLLYKHTNLFFTRCKVQLAIHSLLIFQLILTTHTHDSRTSFSFCLPCYQVVQFRWWEMVGRCCKLLRCFSLYIRMTPPQIQLLFALLPWWQQLSVLLIVDARWIQGSQFVTLFRQHQLYQTRLLLSLSSFCPLLQVSRRLSSSALPSNNKSTI